VKLCIDTGVAGLSIEDNSGRSDKPLYDFDLAIERIKAAGRQLTLQTLASSSRLAAKHSS
jgi:2-methylisocitrate lyase-like PEP mutase family enzyme